MSIENNFLECKKQRLADYKIFIILFALGRSMELKKIFRVLKIFSGNIRNLFRVEFFEKKYNNFFQGVFFFAFQAWGWKVR